MDTSRAKPVTRAAANLLEYWQLCVARRADELARAEPWSRADDLARWRRAEEEVLGAIPAPLARAG